MAGVQRSGIDRCVMQQENEMADFINPSWIKTSDYPADFLPAGSIAIDQASEDGDYTCTVKGFYDPATGEYHIQEVVHNAEITGPERRVMTFEDAALPPALPGPVERPVVRLVGEQQPVAALYVETDGAYVGVPGVDPWDEPRDARRYAGPHPVVAHPPCQRWGRFWHGSTRKPHQYKLGDDGGCFVAALIAVKRYGGVLEHPAHSKAFDAYNIMKPEPGRGWQFDPFNGVYVCHVEQGHYGHMSRKATWLIAAGVQFRDLPDLNWTKGEQRLPEWMIERYGYEKARRIGVVAMVGGKNKTAIRNATPEPFRDLLLSIARKAHNA